MKACPRYETCSAPLRCKFDQASKTGSKLEKDQRFLLEARLERETAQTQPSASIEDLFA